jgi:hypothetical protein
MIQPATRFDYLGRNEDVLFCRLLVVQGGTSGSGPDKFWSAPQKDFFNRGKADLDGGRVKGL